MDQTRPPSCSTWTSDPKGFRDDHCVQCPGPARLCGATATDRSGTPARTAASVAPQHTARARKPDADERVDETHAILRWLSSASMPRSGAKTRRNSGSSSGDGSGACSAASRAATRMRSSSVGLMSRSRARGSTFSTYDGFDSGRRLASRRTPTRNVREPRRGAVEHRQTRTR